MDSLFVKKWQICREINGDQVGEGDVCTRKLFYKDTAIKIVDAMNELDKKSYSTTRGNDWFVIEDVGFLTRTLKRGYTNSPIFFPFLE